jgi:signal transduction histidine kinase
MEHPPDSAKVIELERLQAKVAEQAKQLAETRVSLGLLYDASETLAELLDPATLAQRALDLTCQELAVLRGEFFEITPDGRLNLLALSGYTAEMGTQLRQQAEMRLQQGLTWEVVQANAPVILRDTTCSDQWIPVPEVDDGICSAAGLPLHIEHELVGVMCLLSNEPDFFTEERLPFLTALVTPVALALQNARLYAAEKAAYETAELLRTANLAFADSLQFDAILTLTLDYLGQLLRYDCATVLLLNGSHLVVAAQRDYRHTGDNTGDNLVAAPATDGTAATASDAKIAAPFALHTLIPLGRYLLLQKILTTKEMVVIGNVAQLAEAQTIPEWHCGHSWLGLPLIADGEALGILIVERTEANEFTRKQCEIAEALAVQVAVAVHNAQLFQEVQMGQQQLRLLTEQLMNAQEEERQRIARELHDEAGQMLTALKVSILTLIDELPVESRPDDHRISAVHQLVDETMARIRQLAYGLRPPELDTVGLDVALEMLCDEFAQQMAIDITYDGQELPKLADAVSISFYRFVQEALTNSAKHAAASHVVVSLCADEEVIEVVVQDDGRGFAMPSHPVSGAKPLGLGLLGMRERFETLRGQVRIDSTVGEGTTLQAVVPLEMAYPDRVYQGGNATNGP